MNCDCIKKVEGKMIGRVWKKRKVVTAELQTLFQLSDGLDLKERTYSTVEVQLENRSKKDTIKRVHTYCPFCGVKINDEPDTGDEPKN